MTVPASFWTEELFPLPERIHPLSEEDGDGGCDRHGGDQPQRADQGPHDLLSNEREVDDVAIVAAAH